MEYDQKCQIIFFKKIFKDYYINIAQPEECLLIFSEPHWTYFINLSHSYLTYLTWKKQHLIVPLN